MPNTIYVLRTSIKPYAMLHMHRHYLCFYMAFSEGQSYVSHHTNVWHRFVGSLYLLGVADLLMFLYDSHKGYLCICYLDCFLARFLPLLYLLLSEYSRCGFNRSYATCPPSHEPSLGHSLTTIIWSRSWLYWGPTSESLSPSASSSREMSHCGQVSDWPPWVDGPARNAGSACDLS